MPKYVAVYLPADENHEDVGDFNSEKEAWDYIATQLCSSCAESLHLGYEIYNDGKRDLKADVTHPSQTACGCEWLVTSEEDYDKAESVHDLFEAGGWITIDPEELKKKK